MPDIMSKYIKGRMWPIFLFWAIVLIVTIEYDLYIELAFYAIIFGLFSAFAPHIKNATMQQWLYDNRRLNDEEIAQLAIKDMSYAGLMYMASRENPAPQEHILKICDIMSDNFKEKIFPVMVTININEERMGQSTHEKIFNDIRVMQRYLPEGTLENVENIYRQFAFNNKEKSPLIEQGYRDLLAAIENKGK